MFPLIETAVAFAAVMMVASLFVSALVQVIHSLLKLRGKLLADMLRTLVHNFRATQSLVNPAPLEEWTIRHAFARAVLTHPLLHTRRRIDSVGADTSKLHFDVDYLAEDDLLGIVRAHFDAGDAGGDPIRKAIGGDMEAFERFTRRWYQTIGATASEQFKRVMRRLTLGVAFSAVVVMNLDGLHLIADLYRDQGAREALVRQVEAIRQTSVRLGVQEASEADAKGPPGAVRRDTSNRDLALEPQKTASILDEAGVGIGWQSSWITRRFCAYRGECAPGTVRPSGNRMIADALFWLAGLLFSCVMLTLGAPFWATTLGRLVNLKNEVQKSKEPDEPGKPVES
ncbi:MAG: hypothetical protein EXR72_06870 [Myxococcales bacterium]|nr:hypothetical protein [Myxococcales bacterium]